MSVMQKSDMDVDPSLTYMYANYILLAKLPIAKNYPERENESFFVINNYKLEPSLAIFWQKTKDIVIVKRLSVFLRHEAKEKLLSVSPNPTRSNFSCRIVIFYYR